MNITFFVIEARGLKLRVFCLSAVRVMYYMQASFNLEHYFLLIDADIFSKTIPVQRYKLHPFSYLFCHQPISNTFSFSIYAQLRMKNLCKN